MNQTADELTNATAGIHRASIPLFQRSVETPDVQADKRMRAQALERALAKLTGAEVDLILDAVKETARSESEEREGRILHFLSKVLSYCMVPKPCAIKVMGVAYSLDLPLHQGLSMAAMARKMGCTRASLSNAAWNFARQNSLQPSRWMRSVEATATSRKARNKYVNANTI